MTKPTPPEASIPLGEEPKVKLKPSVPRKFSMPELRSSDSADHLDKHKWQPGTYGGYSEWLAKLTPEQRELHRWQVRSRKQMKAAMQASIQQFQAEWCQALNEAAVRVLQRAQDTGDPQALVAVWDRLVGRPDTNITVNTEGEEQRVAELMNSLKAEILVEAAEARERSDGQD